MLTEPHYLKIECETSDDITLHLSINGQHCIEYIQVKTTDGNSKWTATELSAREKSRPHTSLMEKSLLCDKRYIPCRFRLVSTRDVRGDLIYLKLAFDNPSRQAAIDNIALKFQKKFKSVKSQNNNDFNYWTRNFIWDVMPNIESIKNSNLQILYLLASQNGVSISYSHSQIIYDDLLRKVEAAAGFSNLSDPEKKVITLSEAIEWWKTHLQSAEKEIEKNIKTFKRVEAPFLIEFHSIDENHLRRSLKGFDVQYERTKWRSEAFAKYLKNYLIELALKASELAQVNHLNAEEKIKLGVQRILSAVPTSDPRLLAEVILHAIIRSFYHGEPTPCKLFCKSPTGKIVSWNAHIIHNFPCDQLWLGRSYLISKGPFEDQLQEIIEQIDSVIDAGLLKEEREILISLREPQHLISSTLDVALQRNTPIDNLLSALRIPVLIAYDSEALSEGHKTDYQDALRKEVVAHYDKLKPHLSDNLKDTTVHIFFVPVEDVSLLIDQFWREISS